MSEANKKTVEAIYAAFGRGDIAFILDRTSEQTHWDFSVERTDVPWHAPARSRAELPQFFQAMADNLTFEAFEPRMFIADGPNVVVKLRVAYQVKRTGRRVDEEQVQWWSFDGAGRVSALRHYEDTEAVARAWHETA